MSLETYFFSIACDKIGRRSSMLAGLFLYFIGALGALIATDFALLLFMRMVSAFGAAVGSVATQTMMRDLYQGKTLSKAFAVMGIALSVSPVIGLTSGGILVALGGAMAVFCTQIVIAVGLFFWCFFSLFETRTSSLDWPSSSRMVVVMLLDGALWKTAAIIALMNVMLYGFYAVGPFLFARLGYSSHLYGIYGMFLAGGGVIGALINRVTVHRDISVNGQILSALAMAFASGILFWIAQKNGQFFLPCLLLAMAYGLAIPALLSTALRHYQYSYGVAGAFLGFIYYILIAIGMAIAGRGQSLALTILLCTVSALLLLLLPTGKKIRAPDNAGPNGHGE